MSLEDAVRYVAGDWRCRAWDMFGKGNMMGYHKEGMTSGRRMGRQGIEDLMCSSRMVVEHKDAVGRAGSNVELARLCQRLLE